MADLWDSLFATCGCSMTCVIGDTLVWTKINIYVCICICMCVLCGVRVLRIPTIAYPSHPHPRSPYIVHFGVGGVGDKVRWEWANAIWVSFGPLHFTCEMVTSSDANERTPTQRLENKSGRAGNKINMLKELDQEGFPYVDSTCHNQIKTSLSFGPGVNGIGQIFKPGGPNYIGKPTHFS